MSTLPDEDIEHLEKACARHFAKNTGSIRAYKDFVRSIPEIFRGAGSIEAEFQPWQHPMQAGERYAMKMMYENAWVGEATEVIPRDKKNAGNLRRLTPEFCQAVNKSYVAPLYVDISVILEDYDHVTERTVYNGVSQKNVYLCHIPIIAEKNSRDAGGYFIINGHKKVMPPTRVVDPYGMVTYLSSDETTVHMTIRSGVHQSKTMSTRLDCVTNSGGHPQMSMKFKGSKALSSVTPGAVLCHLGCDPFEAKRHLNPSELVFFGADAFEAVDATDAVPDHAFNCLFWDTEAHLKPAAVVSAMRVSHFVHANKLYTTRDSLSTQVLNGVREYFTEALTRALTATAKDMQLIFQSAMKKVFRARFDGQKHNRATTALPTVQWVADKLKSFNKVKKLHYFCATGNLVSGPNQPQKKGLCHALEENSPLQKISQMNKIATPLSSDSAPVEAREYCLGSVGRLCLAQTPEGKTTGLTNAPTVASSVSRKSLDNVDDVIIGAVKDFLCAATLEHAAKHHGVWLSGRFIGVTDQAKSMVRMLRRARREGQLPRDIGISMYECYIEIRSHAGRMLRALIPLEDGKAKRIPHDLTWEQLLYHNFIEVIDVKEEALAYVCGTYAESTPQHTHRELFCSAMFGASAATIPNITGQPLPRSAYETSQLNQTIGANVNIVDDTAFPLLDRALFYPQKSLVSTSWRRNSGVPWQGLNLVICVMTRDANQEDALVFSRRLFDLGGARSVQKETLIVTAKKTEQFVAPEGCPNIDPGTGVVKVNQRLRTGDVICGVSGGARVKRHKYKGMLDAVVEKVVAFTGDDGERCVKIRLRIVRVPKQGDKFSTFSAQKGVLSVAKSPENLPYCEKDGVVPDVFVSPFMIPSRMTANSLQEHVCGFACAEMGWPHYDASAFAHSVTSILEDLKRRKFKGSKCRMRDGTTGMNLGVHEIGIVKMNVLNKLHDKARYRCGGQHDSVTGQPLGGKRGKALKMGTMENAALTEHNASAIIVDAKKRCDPTTLRVCASCGNTNVHMVCTLCGGEVKDIHTTTSFVRTMQVAKILGVGMRIET